MHLKQPIIFNFRILMIHPYERKTAEGLDRGQELLTPEGTYLFYLHLLIDTIGPPLLAPLDISGCNQHVKSIESKPKNTMFTVVLRPQL